MIRNLPAKWDLEADVVALGSGIGGLSAAITAHGRGARAIVIERSSQVGGVTALSMGEVWVAGNHHAAELGIEDSVDSGFRYLQRLAMGYGSDLAILGMVVHARQALSYFEERIGLRMEVIRDCPDYYYGTTNDSVAEGRMLECAPFPGPALGEEWQAKTRLSPQMPYGLTHRDMFAAGGVANMIKWDFALMGERLANDERCLGPGLAAYFVKGALDRGIPLLTGASAEELIGDGTRIVGVRVVRDGQDLFVKANKGVVIAVSSYEQNQDYNRTLSRQLEQGSMLFSGINGAHFRLAGPLGARVASVPDITSLGMIVPGEEDEEGRPLWRTALPVIGQPHTIVPGQDWPEGFGHVAGSLRELAGKIGVDADGLEATIATFNANAERGEDPDFGRGTHPWSAWMCGDPFHQPNPNLGPLVKPPFYAVELQCMGGTAIPSTGLLTDIHSRVVGWDDRPIPGLYAAGNSVARMETGAVMQSGISNARGMTHGWLAARHATGDPSTALEAEARRMDL